MISKLITKIGILGLKINLQNAHRAKLVTVTRNPPKFETKQGFSELGGRNAIPQIVPK
jgi:hypothetical protein